MRADCKCAYLGVEALGILGDSVELWETEHVLLAARPVEYPQSERRQCSKYLHHTHRQDATIKTQTMTLKIISIHICLSLLKGISQCFNNGEPEGASVRSKLS